MIHIYTGNGKGKSTACFGLALRAAGRGFKIYIGQFIKGGCFGEHFALRKIKNIKIEQFGKGCFIKKNPTKKDIDFAHNGLLKIQKIIQEKKYNMVILDEINVALHFKLLKLKDVVGLIKNTPKNIELVLTGRYAPSDLITLADYVTKMCEIKHPFQKNILARKGIEY
ncbi:MAG: cob(I)yrinic acid a,c-diamide adenosyltransferase [Candidatus Omnitrophota bacterium]